MSEKITPQEAGETSANNYKRYNQSIDFILGEKENAKRDFAAANKLQGRLDNFTEDYSQSNPGVSEVSPKEHQVSLERAIDRRIESIGSGALSMAVDQLSADRTARLAAKHVAENQGAYIDAALTEASHDGVQINIQHPTEAAQPVEVHIPQQ